MKREKVDFVYVSDLQRAQHTAKLVGAPSHWPFELMPELRERDIGVLEGLTTDEMLKKQPEVYQSFLRQWSQLSASGRGELLPVFRSLFFCHREAGDFAPR
jgi:broad specificity phosphatase PhoE